MQIQQRERQIDRCNMTNTIGRETIHSGQFMVSHFEAEEQDEDEHSVAVPEPTNAIVVENNKSKHLSYIKLGDKSPQIESSLSKLFQCMSLVYRQKLTSPKWNRFKGIRLRWKDKIRLNNVIWRCWHMQFIMKQNSLVCQFASPLDVDTHNKPEAVVLEGKYWKRKLAAVTAEYKKWRMFSRSRVAGSRDNSDLPDIEFMEWGLPPMMVDDDYMQLMSDTLFSTISNQAFAFPDSREIARGAGLADFIQPSLGPLQPNLEDYVDTLQPLQDLLCTKLTPVPEEVSMDTSNTSTVPSNMFMNNYQNMESINYNIPNYAVNVPVQNRPSSSHTKLPHNEVLRDTNSFTTMNYMYNTSVSNLQNQTMIPVQLEQMHFINSDANMNLETVNNVVPAISMTNLSNMTMNNQLTQNNVVPNLSQNLNFNSRNNLQKIAPNPLDAKECLPKSKNLSGQQMNNMDLNKSRLCNSQMNLSFYGNNQQNLMVLNNNTNEHKRASDKKGKEMYRSNSLPLNSTLNLQEEMFLIPKANIHKRSAPQHASSEQLPQHLHSSNDSLNQNALLARLLTNTKTSTISCINSSNNIQPCSVRFTDNVMQNSSIQPNNQMFPPSPESSSSMSLGEPLSPVLSMQQRGQPREMKRTGHIHAEQKRRYNIKNGFDVLHSLIPQLKQNPSNKLSKAAMLQKGAEYIRQLQIERKLLEDEIISLKNQAESLNTSISNCQSMLPATGAPVSRQRTSRIREMFREYIYTRTLEDWKFWVFSLLIEPLLLTFNSSVSITNMQELTRTTVQWVDQHCSLVDLRPGVLNALRLLCTTTDILSQPERLPEQARNAAINQQQEYRS